MNLESQVCSLELSKRLCELGVKNEPLFFWYKGYKDKPFCDYHEQGCIHQDYPNPEIICSAFTISELLELLPHRITIKENEPFNSFKLNIEKSFIIDDEIIKLNEPIKTSFIYVVNYYCDSTECNGEDAWLRRLLCKHPYDRNASDALAKMLIQLIENGYVKNE